MKLLSFAVPCYNSEAYMEKCIESLLPGGKDVEILIVDDGSSDRTAEIADAYAERYPGIIRAIHQPNGGHGAAVNTGLKNAAGIYFKVVDSDDWLDRDSYLRVLKRLRTLIKLNTLPDMFLANYVYEKEGSKHKKVMRQKGFPKEKMFGWDDVGHLAKGHYILMHSVIYRTQMLHDCGLQLPEHTFYVDNIYVYKPLPYVKNMYYMDVDLYRYYIGREDQSVNEQTMIRRIDQQIRVNKIMFADVNLLAVKDKKCGRGYKHGGYPQYKLKGVQGQQAAFWGGVFPNLCVILRGVVLAQGFFLRNAKILIKKQKHLLRVFQDLTTRRRCLKCISTRWQRIKFRKLYYHITAALSNACRLHKQAENPH